MEGGTDPDGGSASLSLRRTSGRGGSCPWSRSFVRDFGTMEGTQEALSGKMRLLFTPAARTSLMMLRLNEAALRALQECQQQQVRLAPNPFFHS